MVPQIPYLHAGTRWALGKKHEGTCTRHDAGQLSDTHSYTDFATAGQDAFALVAFLCIYGGKQIQSNKLADFSISRAKVHDTYCRRRRHQSTSTLYPPECL